MFYIKLYLVAWAVHKFDFWLKNSKILKYLVINHLLRSVMDISWVS